MSMAINMTTGLPLSLAYILSTIVVIPLVTHGIQRISQFQAWTQPLWLILQILPLVFIAIHESQAFAQWLQFPGVAAARGQGFDILFFGAAAAVIFPLLAQNGEKADFLRFLPVRTASNKVHWWLAVIGAGPGWVVFGVIKLFVGSFLAVLALNHGLSAALADDPAHMYAVAFSYITVNPTMALWLAGVFVVISQLKINVTNAYAGSIAWGNFFSRLTHSHPGRVVWLVFNVVIALMLMELGLYQAFENILITYACLVVAWVGAVVADLLINKPLGLSPPGIEFRRSHLHDINPVGVLSMAIASGVGILANLGFFGPLAEALSAFIALTLPFVTVPLIAWISGGRYYLCRQGEDGLRDSGERLVCRVCENRFDREDMSDCPSYAGAICSLCCALDTRCGNRCRPQAHLSAQVAAVLRRCLPLSMQRRLQSVTGHFLAMFLVTAAIIAGLLAVVFYAQRGKSPGDLLLIGDVLWQVFFLLLLVTGVLVWLYVLAQKSARFSLSETQLQTELLTREVAAHEQTAIELAQARDAANAANQAKSRYLSGVSHELRTPLNTIFGYAQLMEADKRLDDKNQKIAAVIRRSSEHLSDVIEGLLEISKIEARKLDLHQDVVDLRQLIEQLEEMFRQQAQEKGIGFSVTCQPELPRYAAADEKRLRQILLNLLSNAIKFTEQGQVALQVSYRNQVARLTVRDTGIGIAEADQERIFEPFERVRNVQTEMIGGTGLGLSISRLLVEMMGGNLELQSRPGHGATFCLSLFMPAVAEPLTVSQSPADIDGYEGECRRIMVVDDEESHRHLIRDLLQPLGFVVHQADSSAQTLALLVDHSLTIDLFLLDINMPGMDGWQLLAELRRQGEQSPVILLSADPFENASVLQKEGDFQAYLNKPVRIDKLLEQVQRCLDLQWTLAVSRSDTGEPDCTQLADIDKERETVDTLRRFAGMGYLKGVNECLDLLEARQPYAGWLKSLREMAGRCDLERIVVTIDGWRSMREGAR